MIKILIVDDSEVETSLLKNIFENEKDMLVIGCAKNGIEAIDMTASLKPDLVTMDLQMPVLNGFEATRMIMSQNPVPIVVISSKLDASEMDMTFHALNAGALSVLAKPVNVSSPMFVSERKRIIDTIRSMAEVKVIKRRFYAKAPPAISSIPSTSEAPARNYEIIAIGTSVGGPQVLKIILSALPVDFPIPIVIVQHMTTGFISGFVSWLNQHTALHIKEVENNESLQGGTVYFAPDNYHLEIDRKNKKLIAKLINSPPVSGFCPSATVLLQSVARVSARNAIGILLTGMGNDGAQGLLELKKVKGHTFIQDPKSAVVFGMAGVAQSLGAVDKVVELNKIAEYLIEIVK